MNWSPGESVAREERAVALCGVAGGDGGNGRVARPWGMRQGSSEEMDENKSRLRADSSGNVGAPRGASRLESVERAGW